MDSYKEKHYSFDWRVAKLMGLHQILNPDSIKIYGYNVFHIAMIAFVLEPFALNIYNLKMIMIYYTTHDLVGFIYLCGVTSSF